MTTHTVIIDTNFITSLVKAGGTIGDSGLRPITALNALSSSYSNIIVVVECISPLVESSKIQNQFLDGLTK